jgi:hypothetical protein
MTPVRADDTKLDPNVVRLDSGIEPLVRLLEDTPRERLLEEVAARVKKGLTYREILAALLLAGVRNIQPRPNVGFKFHAVMVVNSAHLAAINSPDEHRWLPIFWALDNFKSSQARAKQEGGWRMAPVAESKLPSARKAVKAFTDAMDNWDEAAADTAVAALARSSSVNELLAIFARYGCRDFRDIGHKAIYVAGAFRALQVIGWHHAEPVLRSLAYALLRHEGENPSRRDGEPDRPGRHNAELAKRIRPEWQEGKLDTAATQDLLSSLRQATPASICDTVVEQLNRGIAPQSVWDGLFSGCAELLMRQPGIVGLHTLTTANAIYHAYQTALDDGTRKTALLQCAAFVPLFRDAMKSRGKVEDVRIDQLEPTPAKGNRPTPATIFADVGRNRLEAARKLLGYLQSNGDVNSIMETARVLIFLKGTDSHDYKFSSAILEDYHHITAGYRNRFLAATTYWLRGTADRDNSLVTRIREALRT